MIFVMQSAVGFALTGSAEARVEWLLGVNSWVVRFGQMSEEAEEQTEGGLGLALLSFVVGLLVPLVFNSIVSGQGTVVFFLVFVALGGAILYGESMLSMPGGVSLGAGVVLAASAAMSWWLAVLGTAAAALALARYSYADQVLTRMEAEELAPQTTN